MPISQSSEDNDTRLFELVADYLEAAETNAVPDEATILAGREDLAPQFAEFVASLKQVSRHTAPLRQTIEPRREDPAPRAFGDYELLGEIGRGGMGVVFRARQKSLNRVVALKMIRGMHLDAHTNLRRFRTEAEAAARLDHPGIAPIFEIGENEEQPYFSMKLLEGGNLSEHVGDMRRNPRRAAAIISEIARALHHAHERGILHRDLKPSNILLDREGRPYIVDFGLAKWLDCEQGLTQTGMLVGTPAYMAPELAAPAHATGREEGATTASDIYGLGAVLFVTLTGEPPFQGKTAVETLSAVTEREPPNPAQRNQLVDRDLATICVTCLQKDPRERYASAAALADDLDRWLNGFPILARPVGRWEQTWRWCRRNRFLAATSVGAALLLTASIVALAIGYVLVSQAREQADENRREAEGMADTLRQRVYVDQMGRAMRHYTRGDYEELGRALAEFAPLPELHGFEYRWLSAKYRTRPIELARYTGHQGILYGAAFSPDGKTVATCGEDRSIHLWNATTGELQQVLRPQPETATLSVKGHTEDENRVCFSPDGRQLVSGAENGSVRLWDITSGTWRPLSPGHKGEVLSVEFTRDGSRVVTAGLDGIVRIWDPARAALIGEVKHHSAPITSTATTPDSRLVISVDVLGKIYGVNVKTHELQFAPEMGRATLQCVDVAPDGNWIATGADDGRICLWGLPTGNPMSPQIQDVGPVRSLAISPDGTRIAVGSSDFCARIWSRKTGELEQEFKAHDDRIWSIAFSPDGSRLLTAGADRIARIWPVLSVPRSRRWNAAEAVAVRRIVFSPVGSQVAIVDGQSRLIVGDPRSTDPLRQLPATAGEYSIPLFSPNGTELALVDNAGLLHRWDLAAMRERLPFQTAPLRIPVPPSKLSDVSLAYAPEGCLAALLCDGQIHLCEHDQWRTVALPFVHSYKLPKQTVLPDGKTLAILGIADSQLLHWSLPENRLVATLPYPRGAASLTAIHPDRRTAATDGDYGIISLIDLLTGVEMGQLIGHRGKLVSLAFSADGRTLASAALDGTVRLWNVATRQELFTLEPDRGCWQNAVAFSPDGQLLLVASTDESENHIVSIYDAGEGDSVVMSPDRSASFDGNSRRTTPPVSGPP